jgi:hypothetical protein
VRVICRKLRAIDRSEGARDRRESGVDFGATLARRDASPLGGLRFPAPSDGPVGDWQYCARGAIDGPALLQEAREPGGRFLRDVTSSPAPPDPKAFYAAINAVDWWRARHARPLARVNANLRYYVRKTGAQPEVTQRLKRFTTIVDKLRREPTMALSTMEDI